MRSHPQAGDQLVELGALHRDVFAQGVGGHCCITVAQGRDDTAVFVHRLRHSAPPAQLQAAKRFHAAVQAQRLGFQKSVAGFAVNHHVEMFILAVVAVVIPRSDRRFATRICGLQIAQCGVRNPGRSKPAADPFDFGHGFEHLKQFDRAGLADEHAASRDLLRQTAGHQPLQRLADRGARHAEPGCKADFIQTVTVTEFTGKDQFFQRIGNLVRAQPVHVFSLVSGSFVGKIKVLVYKMIDSECQIPDLPAKPFRPKEGQSGRTLMKHKMQTAFAALTIAALGSSVSATELRLSHQWSNADVRNQVAQIVADEVAAADVDLDIRIFGSQSLFKAREQYTPLSRGQLDMAVLPLSYAGGQQPAYNLTLMPGLVKNHDHAARLAASPFMAELETIMAGDDVMVLVHGYLAGGFAGKDACITGPDDVQGMQTRAAGKAFEQMLAGAGASIASMSSAEIYNAMQTGVLDAANTSSSSFVSYRIYEQVACYTPPGDFALWFMYQPLLMNKSTFDGLTADQQAALKAGAAKAQTFYLEEAKKEDAESRKVFAENGVEIAEMSAEEFAAWQAMAAETSYKSFVDETPDGQKLLDMALSVE